MAKYVTKSGRVLTESDVERMADEAEAGYEHHELISEPARGRPRLSEGEGPSKTIQIRVDEHLADDVRTEAAKRDITLSEYVRRVLRENVPSH